MYKTLKHLSFGLFAIIIAALIFATMYEKLYGSEKVHENIYGAIWFVALWAAFGIVSFCYIFARKLYRNLPVFLLHCAFGLILVGAFVTFTTADRGYLHIRQGETVNNYISEDDETEKLLPFDIKLILFDIEYHSESDEAADYISFLKIDTTICRVSMNKIYTQNNFRLYQIDYDRDEMGTTLLVSHDPWGIGITYSGYLLLAIAMLWILFLRIGWKGLLFVAIPITGMWFYISQINPMTPILRTPMLAAHVSVIMIAYALFVFMLITSMIGLCSQKCCERFYRWNSTLLYPALFLLIAGIFIGAVWANISWGRYWGWDAKETWALITMLVYAIPIHRNSLPALNKPRAFLWYCVIASLTVGMTFFGVTYFLGGIHSYV